MLSTVLRPSLRRAWRLGRPAAAVFMDVNLPEIYSVPNIRYLNSLVLEEEGPSSDNVVVRKEGGANRRSIAYAKKILGALKAYKENNGDLLVPRSFIVPTGDSHWPSESWGYRLGSAVNQLRDSAVKQKLPQVLESPLEEMGFVFHHYQAQWDNIILPALRHYNKVYGNTDVSKDFVVPSGDDAWPRQTWGANLGFNVISIRNENAYSQQVLESKEELKQLKFCYETTLAERAWKEIILPALRIFHQEHYHCFVGQSFKVPSKSPWPEKAWGLLLGITVNNIRNGTSYAEQVTRDKDLLIKLDFAWDHFAANWSDRLFPALKMFAAEYGSFHVVRSFVVPRHDPWPKKVWDLKLGRQLYSWRSNGAYFPYLGRDADRLEALGFSIELSARAWEKKVVPLLKTYTNVFGDKAIPRNFFIPPESPWPKKMWGVQLGIVVDHNQKHLTD